MSHTLGSANVPIFPTQEDICLNEKTDLSHTRNENESQESTHKVK